MVCGKKDEIIAKSANQIMPLKFRPEVQECCAIFSRPPFLSEGEGCLGMRLWYNICNNVVCFGIWE